MGKIAIVAEPDSTAVALAAARLRVLRLLEKTTRVYCRRGVTDVTGVKTGMLVKALSRSLTSLLDRVELINVPITGTGESLYLSLGTLRRLRSLCRVLSYYGWRRQTPHVVSLLRDVCTEVHVAPLPVLRKVLEVDLDKVATMLTLIAMVSARDRGVFSVLPREEVHRILPLADKLDLVVEKPRTGGCSGLVEVIHRLADLGTTFLKQVNAEPPLLIDAVLCSVTAESNSAMLIELGKIRNVSMRWILRTLEHVLTRLEKKIAVAVLTVPDVHMVVTMSDWASDSNPRQIVLQVLKERLMLAETEDRDYCFIVRTRKRENAVDLARDIFKTASRLG